MVGGKLQESWAAEFKQMAIADARPAGLTALHVAAYCTQTHVIKWLLSEVCE